MMRIRPNFLLAALLLVASVSFASAADKSAFRKDYDAAVQHMREKSYDAAIESFQKALDGAELPTDQARIYNFIGLAYLEQGVSDKSALGSFEQALRLDPKFADAYFNIASYYASNDRDLKKAAEYFKRTVEVDPGYSKAYFGLGWFSLIQNQDTDAAIKYFKKTIEKRPDFPEAQYGLGLAYLREQQTYMVLGSISQLRALKREDLAQALERSLSDLSAPAQRPADQQATAVQPQQVPGKMLPPPGAMPANQQPQPVAQLRHSPMEVIMKGKITRPQPVAPEKKAA